MAEQWTLSELVDEVAARIQALPAPRNGQVRAIPDDRTIRYYGTIGLIDRPVATRGRTALYAERHLAQVVAIKRLQAMGRSLAEIQTLWPTLDDVTLARMSGVALAGGRAAPAPGARTTHEDFWKRAPVAVPEPMPRPATWPAPAPRPAPAPIELRIELAPNVVLSLSVTDESAGISPADIRAIRAAAAALVHELALRHLTPHPGGQPV